MLGELGWWPVHGGAVVEPHPGGRVGQDPPPGAVGVVGDLAGNLGRYRPVPGQLAGLVVHAEQAEVSPRANDPAVACL